MLFFPCLLSLGIVQVNLTLLSLTRSLEIPLVIQLLCDGVTRLFRHLPCLRNVHYTQVGLSNNFVGQPLFLEATYKLLTQTKIGSLPNPKPN